MAQQNVSLRLQRAWVQGNVIGDDAEILPIPDSGGVADDKILSKIPMPSAIALPLDAGQMMYIIK